ncbi:hypothetical protein [Streptomyces sp.]|uniref:hypothetical protein n=1 Tax=Streptomyces sp. TaxID=1931 RepID=UPI002D7997BF|nr:hypothetical protein [Streptomyces sp.]HET6356067.1 hypothetical protein [Streptomyces sp.]
MEMGDLASWVAIIATAGLSLWAIIISRKALAAQNDNAESARRSAGAAEAAAASAERSAVAAEETLADMRRASAPRVELVLEMVGDHHSWLPNARPTLSYKYLLRNIGALEAAGVTVLEEGLSYPMVLSKPEDVSLQPGQTASLYTALPISTEIWVVWEGQPDPVAVPAPR